MKFDMATLIKLLSAAEAEVASLRVSLEAAQINVLTADRQSADLYASNKALAEKNDRLQDELAAVKSKSIGLVDPSRAQELEKDVTELRKRINEGLLLEGFRVSVVPSIFKEQVRGLRAAGANPQRIHVVKNLHAQGYTISVGKEFVDKNWPEDEVCAGSARVS